MQRFVALRGGEGERLSVLGTTMTMLAPGEATNDAYEIMELSAPAGWVLPAHRHPWPEAYYLLGGTLGVRVGGNDLELTPGHFVNLPSNAVHALEAGAGGARFLIWTVGAEAGRLFREIAATLPEGITGAADVPVLVGIAERHHVTNVAPEPAR